MEAAPPSSMEVALPPAPPPPPAPAVETTGPTPAYVEEPVEQPDDAMMRAEVTVRESEVSVTCFAGLLNRLPSLLASACAARC